MPEPTPATSYDALYLSPHLDDAALSCGGRIYSRVRSGERVLTVTVMAGDEPAELSPLVRELHRIWQLEDVMAARRREDAAACGVLGSEFVHWDVLDALYRRTADGAPLYPTLGALFGAPDPTDGERVVDLAGRLSQLPPAEHVYVPLGAGRHVDHVLTRRAAERAFGERRLEYYEDYPYAHKRWVLLKALGRPWRWRGRVWPVDEDAVAVKCRAIACYTSQLVTAFTDSHHMERQVRSFSDRLGGERVWRRRSPRS